MSSCNRELPVDEYGRECSACGQYKSREAYTSSVLGKHGMSSMCRACLSAKGKAKRAAAAARAEKPKKLVDSEGKECSKCKTYKPYSECGKDVAQKDKLTSACKACKRAQFENWKTQNPEKLNASIKRWNEANIDYVRERARKYAAVRREELADGEYARREKVYRESDPERWSAYCKKSYAKNKDVIRERQKADRRNRPEAHAAYDAKKRAQRSNGFCPWANQGAVEAIYRLAQTLSRNSNYDFHVDHIVPLVSKSVQGLHAETNLRIVLASDNLTKGNKFDPDAFDPRDVPGIHYCDIVGCTGVELPIFADMVARSVWKEHFSTLRQACI